MNGFIDYEPNRWPPGYHKQGEQNVEEKQKIGQLMIMW